MNVMYLKTKQRRKTLKLNRLLGRMCHNVLSFYQKPCICFHISFLIIKARLKKYFCPPFPKNKIHSSMDHALNHFKF